MNNSYISYKNYVESTDYYKNLCEAIKLSNELVDNIEYLINALGRDNGELITNAIKELEYFKKGAKFLANNYTDKKNELLANANTYDTKFNNLKSTIGNEENTSSKTLNSDNKIVYTTTKNKVRSVSIDENTGYICVLREITNTVIVLNVNPDLINERISTLLAAAAGTGAIESNDVTSFTITGLWNLNGPVS